MEIICFGILVSGILLIRRLLWNRISRMTQYSLWLFAALFLFINPFVNGAGEWRLENAIGQILNRVVSAPMKTAAFSDPAALPDSQKLYADPENAGREKEALVNPAESAAENPNRSINSVYDKSNTDKALTGYGKSVFTVLSALEIKKYWPYIRQGGSLLLLLFLIISNTRLYIFCCKNRDFYGRAGDTGLKICLLKEVSSPFLLGKNIYADEATLRDEKMRGYCYFHERQYAEDKGKDHDAKSPREVQWMDRTDCHRLCRMSHWLRLHTKGKCGRSRLFRYGLCQRPRADKSVRHCH